MSTLQRFLLIKPYAFRGAGVMRGLSSPVSRKLLPVK